MGKDEKKEFIFKNLDREGISVSDPSKGDNYASNAIFPFYKKHIGKFVLQAAGNQYTEIDITGPPGYTSSVYYPLMFWLRRQGWKTEKADESIDVSPMHSAYYQLTMKQKEDLEAKVKAGIASAAQAVSDYELLSHDERKYKEFLRYYGYRTKKENSGGKTDEDDANDLDLSDDEDKLAKRRDAHSLKAFFIDQVDAHTGDVSLRNIVQRWPTIITDFMRIKDEHIDIESARAALGISKAEAVVLVTKNKLYQEWKTMFLPEVKNRYGRIKGLINSRKKSIEEYKDWVKPYVAKHQLIKDSMSDSGSRMNRSTSFFAAGGHATSSVNITIWIWKDFQPQEFYVSPGEAVAYKKIDPYDKWTQENLIWHEKHGLVASYPWITDKWVDNMVYGKKDGGKPDDPAPGSIMADWMVSFRNYYTFMIVKFSKGNIRFPDGFELEDGIFNLNHILMSQNALLVKLLELKAKQYQFEKYINDLLGVESDFLEGKKTIFKPGKDFELPFKMRFLRSGPYEPTFKDRITRTYLIPMGRYIWAPILARIKHLSGYGKV